MLSTYIIIRFRNSRVKDTKKQTFNKTLQNVLSSDRQAEK